MLSEGRGTTMTNKQKIPNNLKFSLRSLRVRIGMKQEEAAELLGISAMTLRALERDSSKIDYSMILKIEQIYNIPQDYIFFGNNTAFSVILKNRKEQ
jgi:transcriptional regulator with XRE-family HTH domain